MYDIHTHLYWHTYDGDRDAVIQRARKAGVEKMFVIGCTVEESRQAIALAEQYEGVYASVGIHPNEGNQELRSKNQETVKNELESLAKNNKVIAIGECGLDYYNHGQPELVTAQDKREQKEGFLMQLELAKELKLPVIVHCRDAYRDMLDLIKAQSSELRAIILHCYQGDTEVTREFLKLPNVFFSFTGNITYPVKKSVVGTKDDLTETVKLIPLDRMFTETDCPFLAPQSQRGERNEPAYVSEVVAKIAELQRRSMLEVEQAVEKNFQRVFHC